MDRTLNKDYLYLNIVAQCLQGRPRLVALGASERARDSRRALALKMCMFIQEYSLYMSIVSADLFSHSVSSRHSEQIRIMNRTVKLLDRLHESHTYFPIKF